jgi:acetoacetyl-CoA synthetase
MAVSVYDAVSPVPGVSIEHTNSPGELVCTQPFPSQPVCFWNADGGARYRASYFERFGDGVWCQGDFVRRDIGTGGFEMLGRSDGVLNPSGIRFGSSELYEALAAPSADGPFPFADTLAIGQRRPTDADETVLLFVKMQPGQALTSALVQRVKATIQAALSPRHVPKYVFAVPDIPYTINGKKIEIAVKQVVSGVHVVPSGAVANPESLDFFKRFVDLEGEVKRAERAQGSKL